MKDRELCAARTAELAEQARQLGRYCRVQQAYLQAHRAALDRQERQCAEGDAGAARRSAERKRTARRMKWLCGCQRRQERLSQKLARVEKTGRSRRKERRAKRAQKQLENLFVRMFGSHTLS